MTTSLRLALLVLLLAGGVRAQNATATTATVLTLTAGKKAVVFDGFFVEADGERIALPLRAGEAMVADGRTVTIDVQTAGNGVTIKAAVSPAPTTLKWGVAVQATVEEFFTGVMERVVDGPQQASWAPGIKEAMNLRGQKVEYLVKPTTSVYAPFFLSSRNYGVFVKGDWPGLFDFCATDAKRVKVEWEGPVFEFKIYTGDEPLAIVRAHALDAGPPILPPKWMFQPWRWRDEHTQRSAYYDGTPVTGPFNAEVMEDVLMMRAFGIPCGVTWIDRPWGPGERWGYDDFEIDEKRLPHFAEMVQWLEHNQQKTVLWIAAWLQGNMEKEGTAKRYTLAGQVPGKNGNNFPAVDFTNPAARAFWQAGVEKLLKLGVAGFKLDRGEEDLPDSGPFKGADGRPIRELRNALTPLYLKAVYDVARKHRGDDFVTMPRAAHTGSAAYGVFWGGDIGGTPEGLRASIIAVQRAAVLGYPNWGSDTCGYSAQSCDREMCVRWLAFSCFTPIMEVGPTRNVAFWNFPTGPAKDAPRAYEAGLIAGWRFYARLHARLADYGHAQAVLAHETGTPIVRPLFLVEPSAAAAWSNWQTYLYGPDIVVSPLWKTGQREQEVYLPSGAQWRDAWQPEKIYEGGKTVAVAAAVHQIPIFVRVGATVELGDLNREWSEALAVAEKRPDLKALDAEVKAWFDARPAAGK